MTRAFFHRWPRRRLRIAGLVVVFLWFFVGGIAHFAATASEMKLVPPYIPWPRAAVLVSGVFELLGAAGLLHRSTRRWAGRLLFATTIGVTPVHFWMLETAERWPVPLWALVARLPLQAALLALIWWSTRAPHGPTVEPYCRPFSAFLIFLASFFSFIVLAGFFFSVFFAS